MPATCNGPSEPVPVPNSRCARTSSCGNWGTLVSVTFGLLAVPPMVRVAVTLALLLVATRRNDGSVTLPPLKPMEPSVKVSSVPARLISPRRKANAPLRPRCVQRAAELQRATEFRIQATATHEDLLRRRNRQVQRDDRWRRGRRWRRFRAGQTHRQHSDARGDPLRDLDVGLQHVH